MTDQLLFPEKWARFLKEETRVALLNAQVFFEKSGEKPIYPKMSNIFRAFELTSIDQVRVVILGQDPYHNPGQADGLCFSVPDECKTPPSLRNIFKELESDLKCIRSKNDLSDWAAQGVFLLNSSLSVYENEPGSHAEIWSEFTDDVIKFVNSEKKDVVFLLWGAHAQKKRHLIDEKKHLVIQSAHPSPLSAYRGFFGSRPFSQINQYLARKNNTEILWC